jgi:hypothetical protein
LGSITPVIVSWRQSGIMGENSVWLKLTQCVDQHLRAFSSTLDLARYRPMRDPNSANTLGPTTTEIAQQKCEQYEADWLSGKFPIIDNYLDDIPDDGREFLIRELTKIEQRHLAQRGLSASENTIVLDAMAPSPPSTPTLAENVSVGTSATSVGSKSLPTQGVDHEATVAHPNQTMAPTGRLVIRCPHCCNGVELLAETSFEDITCHDCGSTFNLVDREKLTTAAAPKSVGRFLLEKKLGAGGFGSVWLARDSDLDRIVAVKIPRKGQLSPFEMEQFYREARAAAQLRHPHIVPVHEVGRDGDTVFIVSDFIEGQSLSDWMHDRRINHRDIVQLVAKIADALHCAHQQGIIHRDFKPSNVMIDSAGEPHLMDFGLARREAGEVTMTVDGQILGTPTYMSPEQASGQGHWADRRTDVYSFGVMLFKLLTDELPYRGSIQRQIQQRLTEDAPDPRSLNRFIPRDLSTIVLKCLERDPNKRYLSAAVVADELRRFLRGEPIKARPISRVARMARWSKRKPAAAAAIALAAFLAIGGPLAAWRIEQQRQGLAALIQEKNNVIKQGVEDAKSNTAEIARLKQEVATWTGQVNPWKFWPPHADSPPRQAILKEFYDARHSELAKDLTEGDFTTYERAEGFTGLALIAQELKNSADAEKHWQAARKQLEKLVTDQPAEQSYKIALAQCLTKLAELQSDTDREESAELLALASQILAKLTALDQTNPQLKVDWLETEISSGVLDGFANAQGHLKQVAEIEKSFPQSWPIKPADIYGFATYLTREPPVLINPPAE